jgi:hypothetical protein
MRTARWSSGTKQFRSPVLAIERLRFECYMPAANVRMMIEWFVPLGQPDP